MSNEATHSEKKKSIAPKLRFKEFKNNWHVVALEPHIDVLSGVPLKSDEISEDEKGVPILRGINITEGLIRHSKDIDRYYLNNIKELEKFLVKEGDLVIGMDGSKVGKNVAIISEKDSRSILIQRVARIRNKPTSDIRFIYHHIFSPKFHRYVDEVNTSSGIPHISMRQICEFEIGFPSLPEQQKIASFLSAVDEKIQQLTRKKELLEQYKKGMMQQLFSGKLRFNDVNGKPYPKWEAKRLGDVATIVKGKGISKTDIVENGSLECIRYGELYTHYKERITKILSRTNVDKSELVLSDYNDVIIPSSGETQLDIARAACVLKSGVALGGDLNILVSRQDGVFLSYYINHSLKFEIAKVAQGNSVVHLYPRQLEGLKIKLPNIEEQKKMAEFIGSIDDKIEHMTSQITHAQAFKTGLLQQMFL
jgi:type I restriction enzyme, S subunit